MTGISYKLTIDDAGMRASLDSLMGRMRNRQGFFRNVGEHLLNSVRDNFEAESAPDGTPWQPLSPVTIAARQSRGLAPHPILRVTGGLVGSINYAADNGAVRVGTAKVYAAIHHFGGQAGRGGKVTIPARPYLGMSADDQAAIMELAEEWLTVE